MLFSFLKQVQNLFVPSFLSTTITGKLHSDLNACMFAANIEFTALSTTGHLAKGVLYGLNLIGGWPQMSILILIVLVFPKSVSLPAQQPMFFLFNPQLFYGD